MGAGCGTSRSVNHAPPVKKVSVSHLQSISDKNEVNDIKISNESIPEPPLFFAFEFYVHHGKNLPRLAQPYLYYLKFYLPNGKFATTEVISGTHNPVWSQCIRTVGRMQNTLVQAYGKGENGEDDTLLGTCTVQEWDMPCIQKCFFLELEKGVKSLTMGEPIIALSAGLIPDYWLTLFSSAFNCSRNLKSQMKLHPDAIFDDEKQRAYIPATPFPALISLSYYSAPDNDGKKLDLSLIPTISHDEGTYFGFLLPPSIGYRYQVVRNTQPNAPPPAITKVYKLFEEIKIEDISFYFPLKSLLIYRCKADLTFESTISSIVDAHSWGKELSLSYEEAKQTLHDVTTDDNACSVCIVNSYGFLRIEWKPSTASVAWMLVEDASAMQPGISCLERICDVSMEGLQGQTQPKRRQLFLELNKNAGGDKRVVMEACLDGIPYDGSKISFSMLNSVKVRIFHSQVLRTLKLGDYLPFAKKGNQSQE